MAPEFDDDERDGETNEGAGKDVGRVVSADGYPTDSDEDCRDEEDGAHEASNNRFRPNDFEQRFEADQSVTGARPNAHSGTFALAAGKARAMRSRPRAA